jgi:hypothetical protein
LSVVSNNAAGVAAPATVQEAAPNILTYGSNWAVVANPDGSINAPNNGAKLGDAMVAYLIGSDRWITGFRRAQRHRCPALAEEALNQCPCGRVSSHGSVFRDGANFRRTHATELYDAELGTWGMSPPGHVWGSASNQPVLTVAQ